MDFFLRPVFGKHMLAGRLPYGYTKGIGCTFITIIVRYQEVPILFAKHTTIVAYLNKW